MALYGNPVDSSRSFNWPVVKNHHRTGLFEPGAAGRTSCAVRVFLLV